MSVRYALSELVPAANNRAGDFGYQVAQRARGAICFAYRNFPGALIPNPGESFRRGLLSALCSDGQPPPAPSAPFTGGQCPCSAYRVTFTRTVAAQGTPQEIQTAPLTGPIQGIVRSSSNGVDVLSIQHGVCSGGVLQGTTLTQVSSTGQLSNYGIVSVQLVSGQNNCGNPAPIFPNPIVPPANQTTNENITIEGDRNITIPVSIAPTFEEDVCIGQYALCVDVGDIRVNLDLGGITLQLPGTGGGDSGGGGGGDIGDQITNIENITTNIENNQEQCCEAIIQSISSFRNRATELFNEAELRDACIVGLIRNSADKIPKFEEPISERANGFSGLHGITRFIQPLRADSCFLIVNIEPTEAFRGRIYTLRDESTDVEGGFGHCEVAFFDGGVRPAAEGGVRVLSATRTVITFPYVSSGNQIRLSLKGGLNYSVVDPGFRWRPGDLPQCDEIVDPAP